MDSRRFDNKIMFRVDIGEELVESIMSICKKHNVNLASISGIGATDNATIGVYDLKKQIYHPTEITSFHEITNLSGNISTMNDQIYLHFHITLGNPNAIAGHLNKAVISATFEGIIDEISGEIDRKKDNKTNLNLINFKE